jgi:hypothetical protein
MNHTRGPLFVSITAAVAFALAALIVVQELTSTHRALVILLAVLAGVALCWAKTANAVRFSGAWVDGYGLFVHRTRFDPSGIRVEISRGKYGASAVVLDRYAQRTLARVDGVTPFRVVDRLAEVAQAHGVPVTEVEGERPLTSLVFDPQVATVVLVVLLFGATFVWDVIR